MNKTWVILQINVKKTTVYTHVNGNRRSHIKNSNKKLYHSVNSSSHSVNGDIAIQWEWSNFDHS